MAKKMTESELLSVTSQAESDATAFNGRFMKDNENFLARYYGMPYGDEVEGRSKVVSTDVSDVVESDMPSLARVFLGTNDILLFEPNTDNDEEVQEARDKTDYVNWLVRNQPESFQTIHGWMKDAEIQKMGVVKYFIDDKRKTTEEKFTGVDPLELQQIMDSLRGEDVSKVDIVGQSEDDNGLFDITFRVTTGKQKVEIVGVPTESFLISSNAATIDDADLVGDRSLKTRGDLVAEGFDKDLIKDLPSFETDTARQTTLKQIRFRDQGGETGDRASTNDWASQEVEILDLSLRVDFDGDGIAERRHIVKSGNKILVNEPFDHIPYAMISSMLIPHKAIGRSRTEVTMSNQRVKTVVLRQTLDNLYFVNNARNVVSDSVNLDDMLTVRPNGIVRTEGAVSEAVFPLMTEYVGDKSLQIIQYLDFARAQSTGTLLASQGLNSDDLNDETATRFQGVQDEGSAKIELVARVFAETGFRKLYEGIAWLVSRFQDTETEFRVLGKAMKVNPANWKNDHNVVANVGLGAGDNEKLLQTLSGIYQIQQQLKAAGSALTDEADMYNTLDRMVKGSGLPNTKEFFNDPEKEDEVLQAENEQLTIMVQQLQQQNQQLQNPLTQPAMISAQAKLQDSERKQSTEIAKAMEDMRQFNEDLQFKYNELAAKIDESQRSTAVDLTKIEVDSGKDVPGAVV